MLDLHFVRENPELVAEAMRRRGMELSFEPFTIEDLAASARERLETEADAIREAGFEVEIVVRVGDPAAVITDLVTSSGASLVAMGTRGHSGLKHLLLGSTAERVVQHAACPVLTVRREHGPEAVHGRE